MAQADDGREPLPGAWVVRNDISGRVSGPVFQAQHIRDVNVTVTGPPPEDQVTAETLAEDLLRASRTWRARFSNVDFVNLPRIAMLSDGEAVIGTARRAGLDSSKPFRGQGLAAGAFVQSIKPVFETWNAEAVPLGEETVTVLRRGMLVSFEAPVRCRNARRLAAEGLTGDLTEDPYLFLRVGGHAVHISFDPQWLTTSTARTTLRDTARNPLVYSGLGIVAAVSDDGRIRISALVFGMPQTPVQAQLEYAAASKLPAPPGLTTADFCNELSSGERRPGLNPSRQERKSVDCLAVTLFFDEDEVIPGQIDREVLTQVSRIVPEYRRDLGVAVASLVMYEVLQQGIRPADVAAHLLVREPALWKTFTVPGLTTLIGNRDLALSTVSGLSQDQAEDLHELMQGTACGYLGSVELDRNLPMHGQLFPERDQYHVVGAELRLVYSAESRLLADFNGDDLDEPLEEWRERGLFRSVVWEEDVAQSEAEERRAAMILEAWLEGRSS